MILRETRAAEMAAAEEAERARFSDALLEHADEAGLSDVSRPVLETLAASFWAFGAERTQSEPKIRLRTNDADDPDDRFTVLEIITDDMPFLVASVLAQLAEFDLGIAWLGHPIVSVERSESGRREKLIASRTETGSLAAALPGVLRESMIQVAFDRVADPSTAAAIERAVKRVLGDVSLVVSDWQEMRDKLTGMIAELKSGALAADPARGAEAMESVEFLNWLGSDHFIFMGCRDYARTETGGMIDLVADVSTGLGVLRDPEARVLRRQGQLVSITPAIAEFLKDPTPVIVTKANVRSNVHRRVYMDYIGVKRMNARGEVIGERRFVGLFTSAAYNRVPDEIPLIRRKTEIVLKRANFPRNSHNYNALVNILETFPRDELFQVSVSELTETAIGIMRLLERPRTRTFFRFDKFDRFVSVLVFIPRERFTSDIREKIGGILKDAFDGRISAFYPLLGDGPLVRVHYIIGRNLGPRPKVDLLDLEGRIVAEVRSWRDALRDELMAKAGEDLGRALHARYGHGFTAAYQEAFSAEFALADITRIETLKPAPDIGIHVYRRRSDGQSTLRVKLYRMGDPIPLSQSLPVFENMGLSVLTEFSYPVALGTASEDTSRRAIIHDFQLVHPRGAALDIHALRPLIEAAFPVIWQGRAEDDGFNRLIVEAGLPWREVSMLRSLSKFLAQTGTSLSQNYMIDTLATHAKAVRLLVQLFRVRHDPALPGGAADRTTDSKEVEREILKTLEEVASLDQDRILRRFLNVVLAILRTNYYQTSDKGGHRETIAFKLNSKEIEGLPEPRPHVEIFVYSPRVEGVHLRFGPVARGGLRWSDRREDFRTEVLGLVKAQYVKNAVIVPVGAKGGFIPKRLPAEGARDEIQAEGIACYKIFVSALLELTDNLAVTRPEAPAIRPERMIAHDGPDPYLVVAADKGTASFSDIANGLSLANRFWLGDAFASGGSNGYDHKAMAITARGAWEAVKRHFREFGRDIQSEPFTVAGIGDMSGDVFGNGMLLSRKIRLIAAFDHRDIFLDPEPDAEASFKERKRLFDLPRSSWQDFDKKLLSKGGGVFSRKLKSIPISAEVKRALGIKEDQLPPHLLMKAILRAEIDLLWFGGIGTYVKAADERHIEVGDPANDALRVDGEELRATVVGEGANLGLTQRGRIAFARKGGRINTDAIDNSAGVDCSDHEVNIKILLDSAIAKGGLHLDARNQLLKDMTDEVAALVLKDNYDQTLAVTLAERTAAVDIDAHARLIRMLEKEGRINRAVESLPKEEEVADLKDAGSGLTRPEIAVLLAYAKIKLFDEIVASDVPEEPALMRDLIAYFPPALRIAQEGEIGRHRLRREIIATSLANEMVNIGGPAFVHRMHELSGAETAAIARAYVVTREIFDVLELRRAVNALDGLIAAEIQTEAHIASNSFLRRQIVWFLRKGEAGLAGIDRVVAHYKAGVESLKAAQEQVTTPFARKSVEQLEARYVAAGMPAPVAAALVAQQLLWSATDIIDLGGHAGVTVEAAASAYNAVGAALGLEPLLAAAMRLTSADHWERLAVRRIVEDLLQQQADLARLAIGRETGDGARVEAWLKVNSPHIRRINASFTELESAGRLTAARLALAVGHVRDLLIAARGSAPA